jgi:small subunit ribosomal protein S19e
MVNMVSVKEVPAQEFVERLKEELKKIEQIKSPKWMEFAKSGSHRERPAQQKDFWYIRAASLLRRLSIEGNIGVARLRTFYGGRRRRGHKPAVSKIAGGSILRKLLQQLEAAGLVTKDKKGRKLTPQGQKLLSSLAKGLKK